MNSPKALDLQSNVKQLNLYNFQVEIAEPTIKVTEKFKNNPKLPGVILLKNDRFAGMISQKKYWEHMSRPYSLDLASKRSMEYIWNVIKVDSLIIPGNMSIVAAVEKALQREANLLEEPIIVELRPQTYRLLDMHQLLIAYAKVHQSTTTIMSNMYQQLEQSKEQLEHISRIDSITKLANRSVFDEYLAKKWRLSFKKDRSLLYLIIAEIDYFKEYNDLYGYLEGDKCLRSIAQIFRETAEKNEFLAARYGGCKLTVIVSNKSGIQTAAMSRKLQQEVEELTIPNPTSKTSKYITVSCGMAGMIPSLANSPTTLIRAAEQALNRARKAGGNRTMMWNDLREEAEIKGLNTTVNARL